MAAAEFEFLHEVDDNFLECGICFEWYQDANILPCLHSFCERCIDTLVDKSGGLYCPMCRRSHQTSQKFMGAAEKLKPVANLVCETERLSAKGSVSAEAIPRCTVCKDINLTNQCMDCAVQLCYSCSCIHRNASTSRSHVLVAIEDNHTNMVEPRSYTSAEQRPFYCTKHSDNELSLFCESCDVTVCLECTTSNHRQPEHKSVDVETAAVDFTKELTAKMDKIMLREKEVSRRRIEVQDMATALENCHREEERKIEAHKRRAIQDVTRKIEENSKQLLEQLKDVFGSRKVNNQALLKECESTLRYLADAKETTETLLRSEDKIQVISARRGLTLRVNKLLADEANSSPITNDYPEFKPYDNFCESERLGVIHTVKSQTEESSRIHRRENGFQVSMHDQHEFPTAETAAMVAFCATGPPEPKTCETETLPPDPELTVSTVATIPVSNSITEKTTSADSDTSPTTKLTLADSLPNEHDIYTTEPSTETVFKTEASFNIKSTTICFGEAESSATNTTKPVPSVAVVHARPESQMTTVVESDHSTIKHSKTTVPSTELVTPKVAIALTAETVLYPDAETIEKDTASIIATTDVTSDAEMDSLTNHATESTPVTTKTPVAMTTALEDDRCEDYELRDIPQFTRIGEEIHVTLIKRSERIMLESFLDIHAQLTSPKGDVRPVEVNSIAGNRIFVLRCHGEAEGEHELSVTVGSKPVQRSPVYINVISHKGVLYKFGQTEAGVGHMGWLRRGVALTRKGEVLACDPRHERLQVFTMEGEQRRVVRVSGFAKQCIPLFAAVSHGDGSCYITDGGNKQVLVCDENWKLVRCFGKGRLTDPRGVAVNHASGKVYVVDHSSHRVRVFRLDGRPVATFGSLGSGEGQLNHPWCVAVDYTTGNVLVTDSNNSRVGVFTESGEFLYNFDFVKRKPGQTDFHTGIATDSRGYVYVCNNTGHCVMKYDMIGNFICRVDSDQDGVRHPLGICVSDDEPFAKVVVVDEYTGCVRVMAQ